jgi:hypothetical protein
MSHQTGNARFGCNFLFNAVKTVLEQDNDMQGSKFYCDNGPNSEKTSKWSFVCSKSKLVLQIGVLKSQFLTTRWPKTFFLCPESFLTSVRSKNLYQLL